MAQRKNKNTAMAKANKALSMVGQLKAAQERKYVLYTIRTSGDNQGLVTAINSVTQGLTDSQRVGDRIQCLHLSFNFWRVIPGTASGRFSSRFLIILDKQNTVDTASSIFMGTGSTVSPFLSFVKDTRKQFVVLYDSGPNHMDQYNKGMTSKFSRRLNVQTRFDGTSGDITTGAIKLVHITNQAADSDAKPILIGTVRVDYTDS
jgi:hypothetical protein